MFKSREISLKPKYLKLFKVLLPVTLQSSAVFLIYKAASILSVNACFAQAIRIMSRGALEGHTNLLEKLIYFINVSVLKPAKQ